MSQHAGGSRAGLFTQAGDAARGGATAGLRRRAPDPRRFSLACRGARRAGVAAARPMYSPVGESRPRTPAAAAADASGANAGHRARQRAVAAGACAHGGGARAGARRGPRLPAQWVRPGRGGKPPARPSPQPQAWACHAPLITCCPSHVTRHTLASVAGWRPRRASKARTCKRMPSPGGQRPEARGQGAGEQGSEQPIDTSQTLDLADRSVPMQHPRTVPAH